MAAQHSQHGHYEFLKDPRLVADQTSLDKNKVRWAEDLDIEITQSDRERI